VTHADAIAPDPTIAPLDPDKHDRADFSCGRAPLDRFLREQADQERRRGVSQTYVLARGRAILGFYTLSATAVDLSLVPPEIGKKLPRYPLVPAILLGRLAVDARYARQGRGEHLLMDALRVSLEASRKVGAALVVVDALDDNAAAFYAHMGFRPFASKPLKLFLRMADAAAAFDASRRSP
jgi:GNAT superfamily N-acetyltransferase